MIAVDTNLLVYAHREDSSWHDAAYARRAELAEARAAWTIPWPCLPHSSSSRLTRRSSPLWDTRRRSLTSAKPAAIF